MNAVPVRDATPSTAPDPKPTRTRRRRCTIPLLIGLGSFLLTAAVLVPTYATPRLAKIPLDIRATTISTAPNSSILDTAALSTGRAATETGVPLTFSSHVTVQDPSDADVVTLQAGYLMGRADRPDAQPLSATVDRVTLDRSTGIPVPDPPGSVQYVQDRPADTASRTGIQYKFPFSTQKTSYPYFDITTQTGSPIDYVDDDRVENGLQLYHFHQRIDPVNLRLTQPEATLTLSAATWGIASSDEQITFDLWYATERDIWVEPVSGAMVAVEQHIHRYLARSVDDPAALTTLDARTSFDAATIRTLAATANTARHQLRLLSVYLPTSLAATGLLTFATAGLLALRRGRAQHSSQ